MKHVGTKTHSRNTEADITFSANNNKFKHTLLPNKAPPHPLPTHKHTAKPNSLSFIPPRTTHMASSPSYPPLPCTQSLQAAPSSCCHASVARRCGMRPCYSWVQASNSSAPCSALWKAEKLKAPFIITCVGSITTATLRLANATAVNTNEALGRPVLA